MEDFPAWPTNHQAIIQSIETLFQHERWWAARGKYVKLLEQRFAAVHDSSYGLATSNGSVSLEILLRALQIGQGDKVILPAYTFYALPHIVAKTGATPLFVDIDRGNTTINVDNVRAAMTSEVKAVIAIHIDGSIAPLADLATLCKAWGVYLIEDCAQAHGAIYGGRHVGSWGIASIFSFSGEKLMTSGHGGMIITSDEPLYERCYALINRGKSPYGGLNHDNIIGENYQLSEIAAVVLLPQLEVLDQASLERERMMQFLDEQLGTIPIFTPLPHHEKTERRAHLRYSFLYNAEQMKHVHHPSLLPSCDEFVARCNSKNIPFIRGYKSVTQEEQLFHTYEKEQYFPHAVQAQNHIISIYHQHLFKGKDFWRQALQEVLFFI